MADLLGADPGGIVFGRSMTQLTFDFSRALAKTWRAGRRGGRHPARPRREHPALGDCRRVGRRGGPLGRFDPATGELPVENVAAVLSDRTRLVAVTAASNLIGTRPAVGSRSPRWCMTPGRCSMSTVCISPRMHRSMSTAIGADFYACSPYKFLGPHCGVLAGRVPVSSSCDPTSCCRQPISSRSGSNWARCRTSCWPGPRLQSISWQRSDPTRCPIGGHDCWPR